jgi:23S rRNA pseudouridine2605 synthase
MRLAKYLAHCGVASRRRAEELIAAGRITVAGETVTDPARDVDESSRVALGGAPVRPEPREVWMLNKPAGVVSTAKEPGRRRAVVELVDSSRRLYPVGRLDADSTGLILLTNDGELANRLMHPRYGVSKTYLAEIHGPIGRDLGKKLKQGVKLADGFAKADDFRVFDQVGKRILVEVTLHEGRKHIVRRLLAEVGHPVQQLARTEFGPVKLGRLKSGTIRALSTKEIGELYAAVEL